MSRVGKMPIKLPGGVKVVFSRSVIEVSGKLGTLKKTLPTSIRVDVKGDEVHVVDQEKKGESKSLHGLSRSLINNMVLGVTQGYSKELELQGVGYRAQAQSGKLTMSLGFSHPVNFDLPAGISATVDANTKIVLKGADKEVLGQTAANLRKVRPPEPYKGKGIRFSGEVISLKQGKAAGAGAGK